MLPLGSGGRGIRCRYPRDWGLAMAIQGCFTGGGVRFAGVGGMRPGGGRVEGG